MSSPEFSENSKKITIKKSTYSNLIVGAIIAIAASAFFGGYLSGSSSSGIGSDYTTQSELQNMIETLKEKLDDVNAAPTALTPVPAAQPTQPTAPSVSHISLDDDPVKGDPDAPITIVEFSDFQCPFCGRWYSNTLSELEEKYIDTGKVKLVYKDMPLTSIHPNAMPTHIAAECANEQGKFWDYHDMLFERQSEWSRLSSDNLSAKLNEYATSIDLNISNFESCMSSEEMVDEINADLSQARIYGASGTPTFFVGNEEIGFITIRGAQPFSSFQNTIDGQLP